VNDIEPALAARIGAVRFVVFDFDGVFTDNTVYVSENGTESVRCWRGDGIGLRALEGIGVKTAIISTEVNDVVLARSRKLKIECTYGCDDKLAALDALCTREGLRRDQLAFVGNDVNDRSCLEVVGLPIVVQDAHEDVIPLARYRTRRPGGHGAVREVCDLIVRVRVRES
jgi:YrbI family 3-deoxy-D-manno-octulosonate 8-phosphate phosphatase